MPRRLLLALPLVVLLFVLPGSKAEEPPRGVVYLYPEPGSGFGAEAMYAAGQWNDLRLPSRIEVTDRPAPGAIHIRSASINKLQKICEGFCIGQASSQGWKEGTKNVVLWKEMPDPIYIRSALLMHEVAHVIGLSHTENPCALMSSGFDRKCRPRMFGPDDLQSLEEIYPGWKAPQR